MKYVIVILFLFLPSYSFSQVYRVKVGNVEFPTDKVPEHVSFPNRVNKFSIRSETADKGTATHVVQIGEEEHSFLADGNYHDINFSHDVRGLVVYILNDKRSVQGKPFILKKPKK